MAQALTLKHSPAVIGQGPSNSIRGVSLAGWLIIAVFFGVLGTWAVVAPLNGAVVATAVVKVEGNRKSVQHLDGGIVKELRVKDGDKVKAGNVLIVLDDSQARAEFEVLSEQFAISRATEERLRSELDRQANMQMPSDLKARAEDPHIKSIWTGQVRQFETRLAALEGQRNVIKEKIAQLEQQIVGGDAKVRAYQTQLESTLEERQAIKPLVDQGLIPRPRVLQLERSAAGLEGQAADTSADNARLRQAIAEQMQQMAQLENDRMTDITKDLRETQAKLLEVIPRLANAKAVLGRMEIRSPYTGRVVGLTVFSVGGVIGKGEKILDVVPDAELNDRGRECRR